MSDLTWQNDAACVDHPTLPASAWTERDGPQWPGPANREALAVCHNICPVQADCLTWAMRREGSILAVYRDDTILGGFTPGQREALAHDRAIRGYRLRKASS